MENKAPPNYPPLSCPLLPLREEQRRHWQVPPSSVDLVIDLIVLPWGLTVPGTLMTYPYDYRPHVWNLFRELYRRTAYVSCPVTRTSSANLSTPSSSWRTKNLDTHLTSLSRKTDEDSLLYLRDSHGSWVVRFPSSTSLPCWFPRLWPRFSVHVHEIIFTVRGFSGRLWSTWYR